MKTENIVLVGLNHMTAPIACRERAAAAPQAAALALAQVAEFACLEECVLLSTCSRVEVYASAAKPSQAVKLLKSWFRARAGVEVSPYLYERAGGDAIKHLFRVAAGLDSWIIGEPEILGQVKRAYQTALEAGLTGPLLNRAFQRAAAAGKAVRAKTGIQNGIRSVGGAAAVLAKRIFNGDEAGTVVVFGAGEVSESVVKHLSAKNFREILVANRTLENAQALADRLGGRAVSIEEGLQALAWAEVGVFSTSSPTCLLDEKLLAGLASRRSRPLFLIDLGLPRNVAPACAKLSGVYLYDLDDLKGLVAESLRFKAQEKEEAEVLAALAAGECAQEIHKAHALRPIQTAGGRL